MTTQCRSTSLLKRRSLLSVGAGLIAVLSWTSEIQLGATLTGISSFGREIDPSPKRLDDFEDFHQYMYYHLDRLVNESGILDLQKRCHHENDIIAGFCGFFQHFDIIPCCYFGSIRKMTPVGALRDRYFANSSAFQKYDYFYDHPCHAVHSFFKHNATRRHVLFALFDENNGMLSNVIPGRTDERDGAVPWEYFYNTSHLYIYSGHLAHPKCDPPRGVDRYLSHPNVRAVITMQFQTIRHPKVYSLPLGIKHSNVPHLVQRIRQQANHSRTYVNKTQLVMVNFRPYPSRQAILDTIQQNIPNVRNTFNSSRPIHSVYNELQRSKFAVSPSGFGFDCYRTWESLYLGTFPIIEHIHNRSDGWFRTLEDLPVLWVDTYADVTAELLERSYEKMIQKEYRWEKLTLPHWVQFVKSFV